MLDDGDALTVSELTHRIRGALDGEGFRGVRVEGEVSDFHHHSSGHMYFSLVDDEVSLNCAMFRWHNQTLDFEPEDGDTVVVHGDVQVYEARSQYQVVVSDMDHVGEGELYREYLELKRELDDEGLFDDVHKRELPGFPSRVGVVTSDSGAAIEDVLDVLRRRFPVDVVLSPARVQGDGAEREIAEAIERVDGEADVVVVGRGGGSTEDLAAFNEEMVARAIFDATSPVVSAVGHEVDVTIADFVADERAATPSEAAELVVPSADAVHRELESMESALRDRVRHTVTNLERRLDSHESYLRRAPVVERYLESLERLEDGLRGAMEDVLRSRRDRLESKHDVLESMNPLRVLDRGYAVVEAEGVAVDSVEDVEADDLLVTRLADGSLKSRVEEVSTEGGI
ncbi:MAG: exodeoxyribonuclease VII large subunit [Halobacteriales archaeon]